METLLATFGKKVIQQVAESLSQQELKKHMSRKELEELLLPLVADLTDDDSEDQYEPIDVTKKECPPGISPQSALEILRICQRGVPKGSFVHVVKRKIMVPTEQQEGFYRDTKARIFGPAKKKEVIQWLAQKAGRVSDPKPKKVKPAIPETWTTKKVENLLKHVSTYLPGEEDRCVAMFSSRKVEVDDAKMVSNEKYHICAPKKRADEFAAFCAYLDGRSEWQDIERTEAEPKKKGKGKTTKKNEKAPVKRGGKKKVEVEEDEDDEETEEEEVKPTKRGAKKEEAKPTKRGAKKAAKVEEEDEETEEEVKPAKRGGKNEKRKVLFDESDEVPATAPAALGVEEESDDEEDEEEVEEDEEEKEEVEESEDDDDGDAEELDIEKLNYDRIRAALKDLREDLYLNVHNCQPIEKNADNELRYEFKNRLAVIKETSTRAMHKKMASVVALLAEKK